jgi:ABC-type sugar transport system substrate-binding protein
MSHNKEQLMRKLIPSLAVTMLSATTALAGDIGVTIASPDSNLALLIKGIEDHAAELGQPVQVEIADGDVNKQLSQIQNFIAAKVDAIIVNVIETSTSPTITKMAADAGIPLVYVNNTPRDVDSLGDTAAFVGSDEYVAGTLEAEGVCSRLTARGVTEAADVLIIQGVLANETAVLRSKAVHDVAARPECSFMKVIDEQSANWDPVKAQDLMINWITAGYKPAAVISNNDEMAFGAINGLKSVSWNMDEIEVAGIDAIHEALEYMKRGDLDITVYQDVRAQGSAAVDMAIALAKGEKVESPNWIPYQLVTPENVNEYLSKY